LKEDKQNSLTDVIIKYKQKLNHQTRDQDSNINDSGELLNSVEENITLFDD